MTITLLSCRQLITKAVAAPIWHSVCAPTHSVGTVSTQDTHTHPTPPRHQPGPLSLHAPPTFDRQSGIYIHPRSVQSFHHPGLPPSSPPPPQKNPASNPSQKLQKDAPIFTKLVNALIQKTHHVDVRPGGGCLKAHFLLILHEGGELLLHDRAEKAYCLTWTRESIRREFALVDLCLRCANVLIYPSNEKMQ